MLNAYYAHGMRDTAVFELFVRKLPRNRNFMLAAGLEQALDFLEELRFAPEDLQWVEKSGLFPREFVKNLEGFSFTGEVHAMAEGTIFFPNEPVLRVIAPMPEAQLVESRLINLIHFQSVVASKAARCALAAPGKLLVDFGLRRAHGAEAGLLAGRASYLAGFAGTATVLAGQSMGIPLFGTMAHSYVQAHDVEEAAFERFVETYPSGTTLLIDTYDTERAAEKVVALASKLGSRRARIKGVRLDSGDLAVLAKNVRRILDEGRLSDVTIFASGNLDEYRLRDLLAAGAPIDGFGIGTALTTAQDAPALDCAYKLQEYAGRARRKLSEGKATWPGRKQVFRQFDAAGRPSGDLLTLLDDRQDGTPLLQPVMRGGRRLAGPPALHALRAATLERLAKLPPALAALTAAPPYPVAVSEPLRRLARSITPPGL
jgi:nicotinate phosphoribosyltransferase